ncbi:BLUF domain-containing protein [Pacificoceanicola onchidii]|uniref:BLUF domain-containing protein n=1 Tax=Pacificoceanicola onchidii TaxID=2562685 RepID=UPI0010A5FB5D|nr:BLUF domain-containing protein [Pacificoceanicola onchidii]
MPETSLHRIIYLSEAAGPMSVPALDVLLAGARARNAARSVTGFLALHEGRFLQVLEGPRASVEILFATIAQDARHRAVIVLKHEAVEARSFAEWSMGYADPVQLGSENMAAFTDLCAVVDEGRAAGVKDRRVSVLLASFLGSFRDLAHSPWRKSDAFEEPARQVG